MSLQLYKQIWKSLETYSDRSYLFINSFLSICSAIGKELPVAELPVKYFKSRFHLEAWLTTHLLQWVLELWTHCLPFVFLWESRKRDLVSSLYASVFQEKSSIIHSRCTTWYYCKRSPVFNFSSFSIGVQNWESDSENLNFIIMQWELGELLICIVIVVSWWFLHSQFTITGVN